MGFWDSLKKAKCKDLREVGECQTSSDKLPCSAVDQDGYCTAIIYDLDPCGVTWQQGEAEEEKRDGITNNDG